ncbi:MAG: hypothetical protein UX96_C0004G0027 [Candidatus Wolfebacteria bacterium GW2011_GWB1_47_243]|uniref:AtpZ/AtpI family protein n=2 Tax=Candidatus Wolfeibacteriota TaxID=1752735 RepID=A0A0G4ASH9_9BACT|nr:MAG: hypothetical protein UX70_C0001G0415 [Candidatus Wolfebacteria bacterium GW2011_GWB1_47_1]KKU73497.1 MAG: hypothetical protein UX96_C0004G0027 [Candidatus Wolfebacteria bacterium GW2011_GWB1_47_243]HAS95488.1 hypothetical protein [Candidatus Wolfebacteria bacterium]
MRELWENRDRGVLIMANEKKSTMEPQTPSWQPGMQLFLRLSGWIGFPVLIAVVVGNYLDTLYHTDPWLFLLSVGIAFVVSTFALIHYGLKEMKRIESEYPDKRN